MGMLTKEDYQWYYDRYGLMDTLRWFDDYVYENTYHAVRPSSSFAHIVIDDYNLADDHIRFCLEKADDYFCERFLELGLEGYNENEDWFYWDLVNGVCSTVEFLEWLLTIDEDERSAMFGIR